ncbi:hypothetical protein Golomagni_02489 [Golovinomyces magnicellulatus]|nr:hypothetical protein Golomagni_02489 [Golovinomyces magnicellulatus]
MRKFSVERLVYDGSDPSDDWKVKAIGHNKLNMGNICKTTVSSMHEYEAGCKLHQNCLGHLCETSSGVVLPIQSLCIHNINISNVVYKSVETVLQDDTQFGKSRYIEMLKNSMKKKTGRMRRGILNCHIDGSLRMVITPQWNLPRNVVAIPSYLRDKWKACRFDRHVQTCMGISPDILKAFEGDYDGDEMHVNPVYSERAILECSRWKNTLNKTIEKAMSTYKSLVCQDADVVQGAYMLHTTCSFNQMLQENTILLMAEETRTKQEHIKAIAHRIEFKSESRAAFDGEFIRGMADINRRYLTQPIVGDMSRIAKIVSSCVYQNSEGWVGIWSRDGFHRVVKSTLDTSSGNAAVRGISNICACAQQVALDAHRVSKDSLPLHDMISDLIVGSEYTLVVLEHSSTDISRWKENMDVKWNYLKKGKLYIVCKPECSALKVQCKIVAAYNPTVLSVVDECNKLDVCIQGIRLVSQYYTIRLTRFEIIFLAVL